jgi:lipoprotein-releasing system permease protein
MFMITVEPALVLITAAGASIVGTLAAFIPARRAAGLDPVVAIRG